MKKYILVIFMVVNACGMNSDKKQDLLDLAKSEENPDFIKIANIAVTIYRDQTYDHGAWNQLINAMKKFENDDSFSFLELKKTIDLMYETSCKSAGIWGDLRQFNSFIKDAEKIDGPKSGPSDHQK